MGFMIELEAPMRGQELDTIRRFDERERERPTDPSAMLIIDNGRLIVNKVADEYVVSVTWDLGVYRTCTTVISVDLGLCLNTLELILMPNIKVDGEGLPF